MKKIITSIIVISTFFSLLLGITFKAVAKSEQNECIKWAKQAQEYSKFYYTSWQKEQCNIK